MAWRITQNQSRERYLEKYSAGEVDAYDKWVTSLSPEDNLEYLRDILEHSPLLAGQNVLDLGAGTGGLTAVLKLVEGIQLTALEPAPEMLKRLQAKPNLSGIHCVQAFCDHRCDQSIFPNDSFDVIASRQLFNGLFDPIAALENCWAWLKPNGQLIVTDGFYDRTSWTGVWEDEVDRLPLSACRNMAMIPYLMEQVGFKIEVVQPMQRTNQRPTTRTPRYIVVATKSLA